MILICRYAACRHYSQPSCDDFGGDTEASMAVHLPIDDARQA